MNPEPEGFDKGDEAAILIILVIIALCLIL